MKTKKIAIIFKNAINFPVFNTIISSKQENPDKTFSLTFFFIANTAEYRFML